jgi:hypothetical protein
MSWEYLSNNNESRYSIRTTVAHRFASQFFHSAYIDFDSPQDESKRGCMHPPEDEIIKSLRMVISTKLFSVSGVFAARILLDIREQLGDQLDKPYADLLKKSEDIQRVLDIEHGGKCFYSAGLLKP